MRRQAAVGWLCLCTLVLTFAAYGAMALGGTASVGTLYGAERLTAQVSGVLAALLALLLVAASSGAERALRAVALGLAAVALAAPSVYIAAQDVEPAASDTITCGSVTSPQIHRTASERSSCQGALRTQKALTASLALVPAAVAIASVLVIAGPSRPNGE